MRLEFYHPKNEVLRKYMEGYYFISKSDDTKPIRYFTFPNNYCIVSVSQDAEIKLEDKRFVIRPSAAKNIVANLVSRYTNPIEVVYEKAINEITVYFKPLGINHFIDNPAKAFEQNKTAGYQLFRDFNDQMKNIFRENDRDKQIELLEIYWLSKLDIKDLGIAMQLLYEIEADSRIDVIAEKFGYTRQYINKLFLKNIGKSPSEYKKIHRFRTSLLMQKDARNLTDLSHGNHFYDQSHFIKDFKELTHTKPSSFFKNVDTAKGNIWLFI